MPQQSSTLHTLRATSLLLAMAGLAGSAMAQNCAALAAQAPAGVSITTEAIADHSQRPEGMTTGPLLVGHCKVSGKMAQHTGVDGKTYYTGFELRLPDKWNGRFLYQGGGGNDGVIRPAVGPQAAPGYALNRGFAVVTTDAGHQGQDASFGFDPVARVDNAYNAHDMVARTAKALIQTYYAKPADKSYFIGCSGGGRQAMMFTQRFPDYFDGVIAMAPAMRVSKGATIAAAWDSQALLAVASAGADGKPVLSQALSPSDMALLRQGILNACDAQDGLQDGLVSNPAACHFDPTTLQCSGAKEASCLSAAQVGALQKIFSGAHNSKGDKLYAGWPWDPGIGHPQNDWRAWKMGNAEGPTPNSRHVTLMQDALQTYFVTPPDRSLTVFNFNFDTDPQRMDAYDWMFDTDKDVELKAFRAHGGKLMFAHGLADPIFSPLDTLAYYQRLQAAQGDAAADSTRLFFIPGMGHCQGGAATDSWDGLGAMVDWVEKGKAPERIVANGTTVFPGRSRPLCAWPSWARYSGSGDPENAANFVCENQASR